MLDDLNSSLLAAEKKGLRVQDKINDARGITSHGQEAREEGARRGEKSMVPNTL